ncbi:MAG: alpha/beta fold hydrolase [Leptolyngbyaceae cyanobacterium]
MLNFPDNDLSLISQGSGTPTLVFLHYFSGAAASWQWVTEDLKADFRCVALDLPGFGAAPPLASPTLEKYSEFVRQAIAQIGIDACVLVGHSMGGKIALKAAADWSSATPRLEQVILVAPSPPTQEPMPPEERDRLLTDHHQFEVAATTVDSATKQPLPELRQKLAVRTHVQAEDRAWRWWLCEGMNHSIAEQLSDIKVPVTVIASPEDPVIPWETIQQEVIDLVPSSKLSAIKGVGHLIPLEVPKELASRIRQAITI